MDHIPIILNAPRLLLFLALLLSPFFSLHAPCVPSRPSCASFTWQRMIYDTLLATGSGTLCSHYIWHFSSPVLKKISSDLKFSGSPLATDAALCKVGPSRELKAVITYLRARRRGTTSVAWPERMIAGACRLHRWGREGRGLSGVCRRWGVVGCGGVHRTTVGEL